MIRTSNEAQNMDYNDDQNDKKENSKQDDEILTQIRLKPPPPSKLIRQDQIRCTCCGQDHNHYRIPPEKQELPSLKKKKKNSI